MTKIPAAERRSECPVNICLEIFGDRWSLLIVRDLLFKKQHEFGDFLAAKEGIATNILADRLRRLEQHGIITRSASASDARKVDYRLSKKGLDLAPLLVEMTLWASTHENAATPKPLLRQIRDDPENFIEALKTNCATAQNGGPVRPTRANALRVRKSL